MKNILSFAIISSLSFALEFQPLGFTAIGMGGAGVASSKGSLALYYNPALLAKHKYSFEISLGAGLGIREYNLIDRIDKLANKDDLTNTIDIIAEHAPVSGSNIEGGYNEKMQDALEQLYALSKGNGLSIQPTAEFTAQMNKFGIGLFGLGDLTAQAIIDNQHLKIIVKNPDIGGYYFYYPKTDTYGISNEELYKKYSLEYALDNYLTYLDIKGVILEEVPIGYADSFDLYEGSTLSIGLALKYIQGNTYKNKLTIDSDDDDIEDSLDDNSKISSQIGVDIGVLWSLDNLDIGLVGKYLNSPKFKYYDGTKYRVKPLFRVGINYEIGNWLNFALDADITRNDTLINDYKSQYVGGGFNFHQSWFSFRGGLMKNIAEDQEGLIFTGGFGFGLKWFQLDVAGEVASKKSTYNGEDIPRYFRVNVALLSRWGG